MKYYEAHEAEYQRRLHAGHTAWDSGSYEHFDMRPLVERLLTQARFGSPRPGALDIGCGTGALAILLNTHGFQVTALDISQTAIREAERIAVLREASVTFRVEDVCTAPLPPQTYDLITDNHFLHCIVFEEERLNVLANIAQALTPDGEYWIETMVGHPAMKPRPEWNLDSQGITWAPLAEASAVGGCIQKDGRTLIPIRRIRESGDILARELRNAGLEIVWSETAPPEDDNDTGSFRARCRSAASP